MRHKQIKIFGGGGTKCVRVFIVPFFLYLIYEICVIKELTNVYGVINEVINGKALLKALIRIYLIRIYLLKVLLQHCKES